MLAFCLFCYSVILNFARGHLPVNQPVFKSLPTVIKSEENGTVFLPCLVEDLGRSSIKWWKDQILLSDSGSPLIPVPPRFTVLSDGMTIESINLEDDGFYTCEVIRPGPWSSLKLTHELQVMYPPKIFPRPPNGYVEVLLGLKVQIGCTATGKPPPVITWHTKGIKLKSGEENKDVLQFIASDRLMSGIYQCEASNGIGIPVHTNIIVKILHPPEVKAEKSWIHSAPGIKTALVCQVIAEPESTVEWLFNGKALRNLAPRVIIQKRGNDHVLLFNIVAASDFGNYTCRANNQFGVEEDFLQLSGTANPAVFKVAEGILPNAFTLIWEVDSYSPVFEYKLLFRKQEEEITQWISLIIPADSFSSGPLHSKSYTLSGLDRFSLYEAKIFSRNRFGWSDPSEIITFGFLKPLFTKVETESESENVLGVSESSQASRLLLSLFEIEIVIVTTLFLCIYEIS